MKGKKQFPPDVAIAYKGKYSKNGKSGTYLKVILKEDLEAGTEIIAFPKNREKAKETDPDFGFQIAEQRSTGGSRSGGGRRGGNTRQQTAATNNDDTSDDSLLEDDANDF